MKPCMNIVLDTLLNMHNDPITLTYISRSTDLVKVYVESSIKEHFSVAVIAVSMKPSIIIVLKGQVPMPPGKKFVIY